MNKIDYNFILETMRSVAHHKPSSMFHRTERTVRALGQTWEAHHYWRWVCGADVPMPPEIVALQKEFEKDKEFDSDVVKFGTWGT